MNFIKTPIEGVIIVEPRVFNDPRGYFLQKYGTKLEPIKPAPPVTRIDFVMICISD